MAAVVGMTTLLILAFGPEGHGSDLSAVGWLWVTFLFAGLPAGFVLILGWVVAGFRNSD